MRALASFLGGKTPELFALPASPLGLADDPPAEQNKLLVLWKRARGWNISTRKTNFVRALVLCHSLILG
jgi:hypothetical protein